METCLSPFTAKTNILILLCKELKANGKKIHFCRLPFAVNVMLNLSTDETNHCYRNLVNRQTTKW